MKSALYACLLALGLTAPPAQADCGPVAGPCTTPEGSYHIALPDGAGPFPAVVFLHGYGSSGEGTLRNTGMVSALLARGYAVVAPDGQTMLNRNGRRWDFRSDPAGSRDDTGFIAGVADAAAGQFPLDRQAMLLAGFSVGGSMVSYLACRRPDAFAAYAPVAGSFWRPMPEGCAGPVRLLHTHGWTDGTVPLEGRVVGSGLGQGDVFEALQIWRAANGCTAAQPDAFATVDPFMLRAWTECSPGARLDFALHPGGHSVPRGWSDLALDWFEAPP